MSAPTSGRIRNNARIFLLGGFTTYRARFDWLSPYVLIPVMLVEPLVQILLFVYIGRAAGVGDDLFYIIGNAINFAAIPCLFAMSHTIAGERRGQTLEIVFATPAARMPLFLGRSWPAVVNAWAVAMFGIVTGCLLLHVSIPAGAWAPITLVVAVTSLSCTGLGLVLGALALRIRDSATLINVLFLALLIFCGTNVELDQMPAWIGDVGRWLPLTHGMAAARELAAGAGLGDVGDLVLRELAIGLVYVAVGLAMVRGFEWLARRGASLGRV